MIEYVKQRDRFRCGPVAIINALRWAGKDIAYKHNIDQLVRKCKCEPPKGTKFQPFNKTLRKEGKKWFKVKYHAKPTMAEIDDYIRNGCAMVWNFKHSYGRHYALIVGAEADCNTFYVANWGQNWMPITPVLREEVKNILRQHDRAHYMWVLTRLEK